MQKTEAQWIKNFGKTELVRMNRLQIDRAKALLYGDKNESHTIFQKGYKWFYESEQYPKSDTSVRQLRSVLLKIGIDIEYEILFSFVTRDLNNYSETKKRLYFLIRSLTLFKEGRDVNDPFPENRGDVYYFLMITQQKTYDTKILRWINFIRRNFSYL